MKKSEITKDIEKEIFQLRYGVSVKSKVRSSISPKKKTIEISDYFKNKNINISHTRIRMFLEEKLSRLMSLDLTKKGVLPKSIKYDSKNKIWLQHRKRFYLYWFKFLQLCLKDSKFKVNMKKYKDWGNREEIINSKFDDWFKKYGIKLFGIKKQSDKPKVVLITNQPKFDTIYLSYKFYYLIRVKRKMYKEIKLNEGVFKNEEKRLTNGMDQFKNYYRYHLDNKKKQYDISHLYLKMSKYVRNGENIMKGICNGEYPKQMKIQR